MDSRLRFWTRWVELLALVTAPFVILGAVALAVDAWGQSGSSAAPAAATNVAQVIPTVDLTIVPTGDQVAYVPTSLSLPANSTVRIRVTNFDVATPQKPAMYAKVWGTVGGTIQVQNIAHLTKPNDLGAAHTYRALAAATQVSHTFTAPGLHLNVPIAPNGVTTFVIHTGAPGTFIWRCMNPCGSGPTGWAGIMRQKGYMSGTITVV